MQGKPETAAGLVHEYAGDIPIVRLQFLIEDLMLWVSRLPKTNCKTAGADGRGMTVLKPVHKGAEIRAPDENDAQPCRG